MKFEKLEKNLGLADVYAVSTGAMFSSGFFLLPGIAAAETGPSVFLAYMVAGLLILPTMFSVGELSTAMPRAGGTYYFIDRSMGPLMGTIGGYGSWLALVLKSAFALIGMGAYIGIFYELPIVPVAIILTLAFGLLNIVGAKETTFLQKLLVAVLVTIMFFYIAQGIFSVFRIDFVQVTREQFTPLFINGVGGFLATIGMVFVSYAGLTKVASISEEVRDPDRNIPLGMFLSLLTAMVVYVVGVYIMVALLEPAELRSDLTPVATAGEVFLGWLPEPAGLVLVVIAAIAAFASTGNAGIMSASRYPMAMARDRLIAPVFSHINRFGTPAKAITGTALLMIFFIVAFDVAAVAKLASAFQLLLFGLLNFAVIVMRESRIEEYDPGYRSPLYPWMQIAGMVLSLVLIMEMGLLSIIFTAAVCVFSVGWYYYYAHSHVEREGAIFHVHARLGKRRYRGLEHEMRAILREKGLREEDPYEEIVARSMVIDEADASEGYLAIIRAASDKLAKRLDLDRQELFELFCNVNRSGAIPIGRGVALNHLRIEHEIHPEMVLVRIPEGITLDPDHFETLSYHGENAESKIQAVIFLVSSQLHAGQHLRTIAHIAEMVDSGHFMDRWLSAKDERELREVMLRDERFLNVVLNKEDGSSELIGKKISGIDLPGESLVTIIRRDGEIIIPHGNTILQEGDELSIIGQINDIETIKKWKDPR